MAHIPFQNLCRNPHWHIAFSDPSKLNQAPLCPIHRAESLRDFFSCTVDICASNISNNLHRCCINSLFSISMSSNWNTAAIVSFVSHYTPDFCSVLFVIRADQKFPAKTNDVKRLHLPFTICIKNLILVIFFVHLSDATKPETYLAYLLNFFFSTYSTKLSDCNTVRLRVELWAKFSITVLLRSLPI